MDTILNFETPLDMAIFDKAVSAFFERGDQQVGALLVAFQDNPLAWTRVDQILEQAQNPQSKMLALNVLEKTVQYRWAALPQTQREGIRTYIVNLIIKLSSDAESLKTNSVMLRKLNMVLVQIVKQEWPHSWPGFIPELVSSSKTSQSLCANNMQILLLLSEEIFDFGNASLTSEKMKTMKVSLNSEFTLIYQLCEYIMDHSTDVMLLSTTLRTLLRFLVWIPIGYIFETKLIETMVMKFFPAPQFRNDTLQCLTEIAGLVLKDDEIRYEPKLQHMFVYVIRHVSTIITPDTDLSKVFSSGDETSQNFIRHLALFISAFCKPHSELLENGDDSAKQVLIQAMHVLLKISRVDDVVIWKICLEQWSLLVESLYNTQRLFAPRIGDNQFVLGTFKRPPLSPRLQLYMPVLSQLRLVMISKMAKPEEVLIVEDENGEIVRESMRDTDSITLYKSMRDALIYLTHLDPIDTQEIMLSKLQKQVDGSEFSWNNLNTLCWAIGSISGALSEQAEKTFLVRVIKDLLGLCEMKRGKDHKAVIASNIMYVVGQYPRFLKQHWKFLKTVVNKLFEFMHESHPGVQDMSVDTFLKIANKCKKKFVQLQLQETRPFIEEILENMPITIKDLEQGQIHVFYEAVGQIIQSEVDPTKRQQLIFKLMELPNQSWTQIINQANQSPDSLYDSKVIKQIIFVLKTNSRACNAIGSGFIVQLARIYVDMLQLYKMYSGFVSQKIAEQGAMMTKTAVVRGMRSVKKEVLSLIRTFVANSESYDSSTITTQFLPALIDPVLDDYKRNVPEARDAEVLLLFAEFVSKLGSAMVPFIGRIFDSVFQVTLDMITKNFEDFPDARIMFFRLLQAINLHAFEALLQFSSQQFQLIMDSVIWALKHLERNVAETGLQILLDLIQNISRSEAANAFFQQFYIPLLQDMLGVLTDTFHKPGFKLQATILAKLFHLVDQGIITAPLWVNPAFNPGNQQYPNNQAYVRSITIMLLRKAFPNVAHAQIESFVNGLFQHHGDLANFKTLLRDFLIATKEFAGGSDNAELFAEEAAKQQQELERQRQQDRSAVQPLFHDAAADTPNM